MKTVVYPLIHLRLMNGETARFWHDNWSPFGCLYDYLGASSSRLGIPLNATVASLFRNGSWRLPPARSEHQLNLLAYLTTIQLSEGQDTFSWELEGKAMMKFETGKIYHYLRGITKTKEWAPAVWSSRSIPRHSFHAWLVVLDRNPTQDRLIRWGLPVSHLCLLSNTAAETRSHLYMDCPFSYVLWSLVAAKCQLQALQSWTDLLNQMTTLSAPRSKKLLCLLAWKSVMYWLWRERNERLHAQIFRSVDSLLKTIDLQARNQIQSFREASPSLASQMIQLGFT
ncbi:uncharacterized protein LOC108838769 [Raphanus sativus]|uniref:Uncharacterized protein LOC108838769 n=1 Tax=Raphanus sativus TaxID=3726 RepID=A0A6J0M689_RAPSA|nr:uncharacterized protein LOC108838769 [Raphanus sativus]